MFVPRETQECQGPEAPSSFTHHGSISLPTQPVENFFMFTMAKPHRSITTVQTIEKRNILE